MTKEETKEGFDGVVLTEAKGVRALLTEDHSPTGHNDFEKLYVMNKEDRVAVAVLQNALLSKLMTKYISEKTKSRNTKSKATALQKHLALLEVQQVWWEVRQAIEAAARDLFVATAGRNIDADNLADAVEGELTKVADKLGSSLLDRLFEIHAWITNAATLTADGTSRQKIKDAGSLGQNILASSNALPEHLESATHQQITEDGMHKATLGLTTKLSFLEFKTAWNNAAKRDSALNTFMKIEGQTMEALMTCAGDVLGLEPPAGNDFNTTICDMAEYLVSQLNGLLDEVGPEAEEENDHNTWELHLFTQTLAGKLATQQADNAPDAGAAAAAAAANVSDMAVVEQTMHGITRAHGLRKTTAILEAAEEEAKAAAAQDLEEYMKEDFPNGEASGAASWAKVKEGLRNMVTSEAESGAQAVALFSTNGRDKWLLEANKAHAKLKKVTAGCRHWKKPFLEESLGPGEPAAPFEQVAEIAVSEVLVPGARHDVCRALYIEALKAQQRLEKFIKKWMPEVFDAAGYQQTKKGFAEQQTKARIEVTEQKLLDLLTADGQTAEQLRQKLLKVKVTMAGQRTPEEELLPQVLTAFREAI